MSLMIVYAKPGEGLKHEAHDFLRLHHERPKLFPLNAEDLEFLLSLYDNDPTLRGLQSSFEFRRLKVLRDRARILLEAGKLW